MILPGNSYRRLLEGAQTSSMLELAMMAPRVSHDRIQSDGRAMFGIAVNGPETPVSTAADFLAMACSLLTRF